MLDARSTTTIGDDLLRLVFIACHPVLSTEARVALTLRLLGGLTTDEIARAFLVPEPTIAQRIVRAKRTLAEAHVPFEVPRGAELAARLASVLEVIYLDLQRGLLGDRRRRLDAARAVRGRAAARAHPRRAGARRARGARPRRADGDPGVARARRASGPTGEPVLLLDQDRARWDQLLIRRGLAALERAERSAARAGRTRCRPRSPRATRARARADETDWARIAALYGALARVAPSPVVELNRAVAVVDGATVRRPGSRSSTRSPTSRRCAATTCCRACAAICSASSGASTRRRRVRARRGADPQQPASASCCSRARARAARDNSRNTRSHHGIRTVADAGHQRRVRAARPYSEEAHRRGNATCRRRSGGAGRAPKEAKSFALVVHDPDAPLATPDGYGFVHWLLYNIPASVTSLAEGESGYTNVAQRASASRSTAVRCRPRGTACITTISGCSR